MRAISSTRECFCRLRKSSTGSVIGVGGVCLTRHLKRRCVLTTAAVVGHRCLFPGVIVNVIVIVDFFSCFTREIVKDMIDACFFRGCRLLFVFRWLCQRQRRKYVYIDVAFVACFCCFSLRGIDRSWVDLLVTCRALTLFFTCCSSCRALSVTRRDLNSLGKSGDGPRMSPDDHRPSREDTLFPSLCVTHNASSLLCAWGYCSGVCPVVVIFKPVYTRAPTSIAGWPRVVCYTRNESIMSRGK